MASPVEQLPCPSDCSDSPSASPSGPNNPPPVGTDDDDLWMKFLFSDEDDGLCDLETTCPGLSFTKEEEKIRRKWVHGYINLCGRYAELCNESLRNGDASFPLPPGPLKVLPETISLCIERGYCYDREYMTNDTLESKVSIGFHDPADQTLGYCEPHDMLFNLSCSDSHPISVYGTFAIRDDLELLRNYIFNRPRDDPVTIDQDSFDLPLYSACRGMYVLNRALLEVDLWVKREGDKSIDEQLLSVYIEIELRCT